MKIIALLLLLMLTWLQYKIWLQDGGIPVVLQLQRDVEVEQLQVEKLQERNQSLDAEVKDLKKGLDAIEERARSEMGMIKKGEVYYQVIMTDSHGSGKKGPGKNGLNKSVATKSQLENKRLKNNRLEINRLEINRSEK